MKRLKILLSRDFYFTLTLPVLNRSKDSLVKGLFFLGLFSFSLFFVLLPISGSLGISPSLETDYFKFLVVFTLFSFIIYLLALVLNGKSRLVDPPNLLNVLTFALLTTIASVFVIPASVTNTFGIVNMRTLSGIFIMCSVVLFYLINVYIKDKVIIRRFLYLLTFGYLSLFIYLVASSFGSNTLIANNIINIAPLFILIGGLVMFSRFPKKITVSLFVIISALTVVSLTGYTGMMQSLFYVINAIGITMIIVSILFILINRQYLKNRVRELKMKKNKNWKTRLKLLTPFLLLITPVFLIIFGLIVQIISKQNFFSVFSSIHDISLGVNNLAANAAANSSLIFYIIGLGGRALNPDFSFFGNIISSQGIVGVIAYLFLGITSVYFGYKIFRKRLFENRDYKLVLLLLFIMIYSIVMHFFTVPGILTTTLWWISFALISAFSQIDKKSDAVILKDLGYVESKALKVKRINFQYVLVLAIVLFGIGAFVFFSRLVF